MDINQIQPQNNHLTNIILFNYYYESARFQQKIWAIKLTMTGQNSEKLRDTDYDLHDKIWEETNNMKRMSLSSSKEVVLEKSENTEILEENWKDW